MLGLNVKSAVKCHLFIPPRLPGEPAPAAEKNPRGNTVLYNNSGVMELINVLKWCHLQLRTTSLKIKK